MHGAGIYIYIDKVRYDGHFVNDKKEGFGIYKWLDGRKYEGWWHKGKQHGLGKYFGSYKENSKRQSMKYGFWENGKRLKWYDED